MAQRVRLVLVHGSQVNRAVWLRYTALLGPEVDVVTPDLPAHGARVLSGRRIGECMGVGPDDAWWGHMPLFWSGGFVIGLVVALAGLFVPIPFMALEILLGLVQAYIFTVLATVFIGAAIDKEGRT